MARRSEQLVASQCTHDDRLVLVWDSYGMTEGSESFERPIPFKKGDLVQLAKKLERVRLGGDYKVGEPYIVVCVDPPSKTEPYIWIGPLDTPQDEMDSFDSSALTGEKGHSEKFFPCRPEELERFIRTTLH